VKLRAAAWNEFELDSEEPIWRVPASRMKMGEQHIVPLPRQVVALLKRLQPITGILERNDDPVRSTPR
jgi:integrase